MAEHDPAPRLDDATTAARRELARLGRRLYEAGWMLGTSGNLSVRVGDHESGSTVLVTASGVDKGALSVEDFVEVDGPPTRGDAAQAPSSEEAGGPKTEGALRAAAPGRRASAETSIHLAIYRRRPGAGAVLHVHTVASTLVGGGPQGPGVLRFRDVEMLKAFGLDDRETVARLPVFDNAPEVARIAAEVDDWLVAPRAIPAFVVWGHGLTAWGPDLASAHRHLEAAEFLCRLARQRDGGA